MSNSIWKTPDQKPDADQHVLFFAGGGIFPYLGFYYPKFDTFNDWKSKDVQRWASVFEVIAQADKAERLQKAVDLLVDSLERIQNKCRKAKMTEINYGKIDGIEAVVAEAIKEIKQLIKED